MAARYCERPVCASSQAAQERRAKSDWNYMRYGTGHTQGQDSAAQQAHKQTICQAQTGQAVLERHVAQAQGSVPQATPSVRSVRLAGQRSRSHQASNAGRWLLRRPQPAATVHAMPQPQERQGEGWYDDASWTWGDYYDDLCYITYE
jgi:hypothetical protein